MTQKARQKIIERARILGLNELEELAKAGLATQEERKQLLEDIKKWEYDEERIRQEQIRIEQQREAYRKRLVERS